MPRPATLLGRLLLLLPAMLCAIGRSSSAAAQSASAAAAEDPRPLRRSPRVVHVDPEGRLASGVRAGLQDGSTVAPFTSVLQARDALRDDAAEAARAQPRTVLLHGTEHLPQPLVLDRRDDHVRWVGADDDARMTGGVPVPFSAWSSVVVPSGAKGAMKASLGPLGFNASNLGKMAAPHPKSKARLYVDGSPMELARAPNIAPNGTWMWYGYEKLKNSSNMSFTLADAKADKLLRPALAMENGLWLHGYWKFDWRDTYIKIDSMGHAADGGATTYTRDAATPPQYPFTDGCRFYAVDSLQFLDTPGEYFIDVSAAELYFIPLSPLTPKTDVLVSMLLEVVRADAHHTAFEGITVSTAREDVLGSIGVENLTISGCTVSNSGSSCLAVSGDNITVEKNTLFGCGGCGMSISSGDVATLGSGNSRVVGNVITNFSLVVRTYQAGIGFQGVGLYVAHNNVSHGPHTAITGGGNDHLFEFNRIERACFECTDTGAFYVGRSWSQRGNVVRYNVFDTIRPTERLAQKSCSQNAFYLDDQMSGYEFYGNTIINSTTGVLLGGGRHNSITNNTFINNDKDIAFDDRGQTWQKNYCRHNCTSDAGAHGGFQPACFLHELEKIQYTQPPYSTRYPALPKIYADEPCTPVHNVVSGNKYCHAHSTHGAATQFIDKNASVIKSWSSTLGKNTEFKDC